MGRLSTTKCTYLPTWEWGGLWGQWLEQCVGAGVAAEGVPGTRSRARAIHAVWYWI